VGHLRANGFAVKAENLQDLRPVKARHGVPRELESCHTAAVDGYVVEGHVPAETIRRLLRERPPVTGIAVPGMPIGSPGMESPGHPGQRYDVSTFDRKGAVRVYERR
jgi:hypothetical protein